MSTFREEILRKLEAIEVQRRETRHPDELLRISRKLLDESDAVVRRRLK